MIKLSLEQVTQGIFTEQIPDSRVYIGFFFPRPCLVKKGHVVFYHSFSPHIYKVSPSGSPNSMKGLILIYTYNIQGLIQKQCHTMNHASRYINWNINICPNKLSIRIRNLIKFCWMIKKIWMFITWYKLDIAVS